MDSDLSNKGFAYVQFEFENSVPRAMRLRPGQVGNRPIKRFRHTPNPHVKRSFNHVPSFSSKSIQHASSDATSGALASRGLASHKLSMGGATVPDSASNSGDGEALDTGGLPRVASMQQQERSARLSAGQSATGYVHPHASLRRSDSLQQTGSLSRPESLPTSGRPPTAPRSTTSRRMSRVTQEFNAPAPPLVAGVTVPETRTLSAPLEDPPQLSGKLTPSEPLGSLQAGPYIQTYAAPSSSEDIKKAPSDVPIGTLQPLSAQVRRNHYMRVQPYMRDAECIRKR